MVNIVQNHLSKKKGEFNKLEKNLAETMLTSDYLRENITVYNSQSGDYTTFTQSQSVILISLKRYLENLIEVGHELGLCGLFFFAKDLRQKLKKNQAFTSITDRSAREVFDDIFQRLECLVDDILKNLYRLNKHNYQVLLSPKVMKLLDRIIEQQEIKGPGPHSRCIVFVERVNTATILSQVLSDLIESLKPPWNTRLKVKHVTGIKVIFSDKPMTAKYQVRIWFY
jgi:ERCC4-related helicase